jgi:hypothetical protein
VLYKKSVQSSICSTHQDAPVLYKLLDTIDRVVGFERAKAHCDIPGGIYDPIAAQISA